MKAIMFALLLVAYSIAATYYINDCGITSASSGSNNVFILNNSINITDSSTLTDGACIYLNITGTIGATRTQDWYGNNKIISKINGSATKAIHINAVVSNGNYLLILKSQAATNRTTINNIDTGFYIFYSRLNTDVVGAAIEYPTSETGLNFNNVSMPFDINASILSTGTDQIKILAFAQSCNTTSPSRINIYTTTAHTLNLELGIKNNSNCGIAYIGEGGGFATATNNSNVLVFYSNKLFFSNGYLNLIPFNTNSSRDDITINSTFTTNINYSYFDIGQNLFLNGKSFQIFLNGTEQLVENTQTVGTINNSKTYYCIGGLCNPLYFTNFSSFPFYINAPDTLQPAIFLQNYTTIKFYWKQGIAYSLIASSKNNEDSVFYLQPNGEFIAEVNATTNTTFTYNCPSSFSYCYIQFANGTYSISEIGTLASLLADTNYNIFYSNGTANFTPATNYLPPEVNISFSVLSSSGIMEYYGFNITKEYNLTKTTVCFQNITTDNGSTLNCSTDGKGIYKIYTWFKLKNYYVYGPTTKTLFIGNATGLALISQKLQGENVISGFAYTILLLILAAVGAGFASNYLDTGAGLVGWTIFTIGAILWPGAIVFGEVSVIMVAAVSGIIGLAWYGIKQYV